MGTSTIYNPVRYFIKNTKTGEITECWPSDFNLCRAPEIKPALKHRIKYFIYKVFNKLV